MATVDLGKLKPVWKGTWAGSTSYEKDDIVQEGVSSYICTTAHTSDASTFSNDSANWDTMATGANIPGQTGNSGKVLKTDGTNLSWGTGSALLGMKYVRYTPASDRILPNGDPITQLNITYTPVSSDSHIELSWNGAIVQNGSDKNLNIKFYRDTTALGTGQNAGGQNEANVYMNSVEQNLYVSEFATGHTGGTSYTWKVYTWANDSAWVIESDQTHRMILKEWSGDVVTYVGENT